MPPIRAPKAFLNEFRRLLEAQIKVDIAQAIRQHPHLTGDDAVQAYERLTGKPTVNRLVRDLAYEEAQAAVDRGEAPAAALLYLAGFSPNPIGEC
ncbi:MAG: hypothetical protein V3T05_11195 [Myxococcota bacterium]